MKLVVGLMVIGLGLIVMVPGVRLLWTGSNLYPSWMTRGRGNYLLLDRAPTTYFRTYGGMAILGGLLIAQIGLVFVTPEDMPGFARSLLGTAFLLTMAALAGSFSVLAYMVNRYKMRG